MSGWSPDARRHATVPVMYAQMAATTNPNAAGLIEPTVRRSLMTQTCRSRSDHPGKNRGRATRHVLVG